MDTQALRLKLATHTGRRELAKELQDMSVHGEVMAYADSSANSLERSILRQLLHEAALYLINEDAGNLAIPNMGAIPIFQGVPLSKRDRVERSTSISKARLLELIQEQPYWTAGMKRRIAPTVTRGLSYNNSAYGLLTSYGVWDGRTAERRTDYILKDLNWWLDKLIGQRGFRCARLEPFSIRCRAPWMSTSLPAMPMRES